MWFHEPTNPGFEERNACMDSNSGFAINGNNSLMTGRVKATNRPLRRIRKMSTASIADRFIGKKMIKSQNGPGEKDRS